ncbi:hypothetical protein C5167_015902 [Papaver somniferum]|nr:hypothetical protein C5167_015902 [Papaver somniferum]
MFAVDIVKKHMTIEERLLQNERQRDRYRARQQNIENMTNMMTEEKRVAERERRRVSYKNRQENLTNEERLLQNAQSLTPHRSPRFIGCGSTTESLDQGQSRDPQTTIANNGREKQLWRSQHKSKQEKITKQQKQAFDERQRIAYLNRKTGINEASASSSVQVSKSAGAHKAESTFIPR